MPRRKKKRSSQQTTAAKPFAPHSGRLTAICLAMILAVTWFVYWPAAHGTFLVDDPYYLTRPELRSLDGLYRIWFDPRATLQYFPLTDTLFWFEHKLWGDAAFGYHLANVFWHSVAVVLGYFVLRALKVPGALLAAAIFALHPVMVESVAWICEQKNTLSTVLYLSTLLAYFRFDETRRPAWYLASFGLFFLALAGKTATVTLPVAVLIIFWWQRGTLSWRRDVAPIVPYFVLAAVAGLVTTWVEYKFNGARVVGLDLRFYDRVLVAGRAIWFYLGKLVWPQELLFIYPRWEIDPADAWQWIFPLAAIGVTVALWLARPRFRGPLAAWLFFCVTLFPTLGFLNIAYFRFSFVADHFQYLPSLGIIALAGSAIAIGAAHVARQNRWAITGLSAVLVGVLAALTMQQAGLYANGLTLYQATLDRNPTSWRAHQILGTELMQDGKLDEAMDHYRQALSLNPHSFEAHNYFGNALLTVGHVPEAIEQFELALKVAPDDADVHINLANALLAAGRRPEAVDEFQAALDVRPNDPVAASTQAVCLMQMGRVSEAIAKLEQVLETNPNYADAHDKLAIALANSGDMPRAIEHFRRALEIEPANAKTQNNLATALARTGQLDEAISHYEEAVRLQPNFPEFHQSLADALRESRRFNKAAEHYQNVLELRPNSVQACKNLAISLNLAGRPDEAIATVKKSIDAARSSGQSAVADQLEEWLSHFEAEIRRDRNDRAD